MLEILQYEFMRHAVFAALLSSVACGIIGTYVVVKRIVSISGGISHASFGGIGLGYLLGVNPLWTLIPFSIAAALGIGFVSRKARISEDTTIGIFWSMGMALGVIFIGLTPGYAPDLFSYLFGNILTVPSSDIFLMLFLDAVILIVVVMYYKEFLALCFDEDYARVASVNVKTLYFLLLVLVAITIVILIRIVGIVLVIALLTMPSAIAKQYTFRLHRMMLLSIIIGAVITMSGLWLSYQFDLPSGATIILLSGMLLGVSSLFKARAQH
jgi:zinc transport system permease protein